MDDYTESCSLMRDLMTGQLMFGPVRNMEEEHLAQNETEYRNVNGEDENEGGNGDANGDESGDANGEENEEENEEVKESGCSDGAEVHENMSAMCKDPHLQKILDSIDSRLRSIEDQFQPGMMKSRKPLGNISKQRMHTMVIHAIRSGNPSIGVSRSYIKKYILSIILLKCDNGSE